MCVVCGVCMYCVLFVCVCLKLIYIGSTMQQGEADEKYPFKILFLRVK